LAVCADDAEGELLLADKIVDELNAGQKAKASGDIARFTANLPQVLSDCESMTDDVARLQKYISIFSDQTELVSTITKNILKNPIGLVNDIKAF